MNDSEITNLAKHVLSIKDGKRRRFYKRAEKRFLNNWKSWGCKDSAQYKVWMLIFTSRQNKEGK